MEGQKEFRRRIMKMGAGRTNSTENNTFTRIQSKVRALLQLRTKQFKSNALREKGHEVEAVDPSNFNSKTMQVWTEGSYDIEHASCVRDFSTFCIASIF